MNNSSCNFIVLLYHCQCFPPDASQFRKRIAEKGIPDSVTIFADRKNGTAVQTDMGITSHSLYILGDIFALILPSLLDSVYDCTIYTLQSVSAEFGDQK